jgi:hypothetical protein
MLRVGGLRTLEFVPGTGVENPDPNPNAGLI